MVDKKSKGDCITCGNINCFIKKNYDQKSYPEVVANRFVIECKKSQSFILERASCDPSLEKLSTTIVSSLMPSIFNFLIESIQASVSSRPLKFRTTIDNFIYFPISRLIISFNH